jgi:hypothetical protein
MNDILNKSMVLVLNRHWQAVNVRTPQEAFCMMATGVATALEIEREVPPQSESDSFSTPHSSLFTSQIRPVTWDEWTTLPIRPQDHAVQTVRLFMSSAFGTLFQDMSIKLPLATSFSAHYGAFAYPFIGIAAAFAFIFSDLSFPSTKNQLFQSILTIFCLVALGWAIMSLFGSSFGGLAETIHSR